MIRTEIAIVGAGIAGASIAAEIAPHAKVLLIEAEAQPGYHSTGRSAAFWSETYGGPAIQPLTSASGPWLASPPPDISEQGFLKERGALHVARAEGVAALEAMAGEFAGTGVRLDVVDRAGLEAAIPGLRQGWERGLSEPTCADIDVAGLHAAYLKTAKKRGAMLLCDAAVNQIARVDTRWRIETRAGLVEADIVVNAAGAWASKIAVMAGSLQIPVRPNRRTMVQLAVDPPAYEALPLVIDAEERFYFKPEAGGRLWLSPHDETPVDPCDVAPEELDVAIAIDRLEQVVDWRVLKRERAWAGLRSFAPDRAPIYGFDPVAEGFFWFAGQGGFGIQTAPAAAMIGAALLLRRSMPDMVREIDAARYAPGRFG
jgi:D-arginine dehydrogenase